MFGEGPLVPESLITGWRFLKSRPQGLAVSTAPSPVFCSGAPSQPCQAAALPTSPGPLPGAARRPAGIPGRRSGLVSQRLGRAVCMCAHLCVCVSVCACVCVLYTYTCARTYVVQCTSANVCCTRVHLCVRVFVHMYICMHVCECGWCAVFVCACVCMCVHMCTLIRRSRPVFVFTCVGACVRVGRCVHALLLGVPGAGPPLPGCPWVMDELWYFPGSIPAF